jgi:hypothetical protein
MAKGQKRSNREIRKPKQAKAPAATEPLLGAGRIATPSSASARGKQKR